MLLGGAREDEFRGSTVPLGTVLGFKYTSGRVICTPPLLHSNAHGCPQKARAFEADVTPRHGMFGSDIESACQGLCDETRTRMSLGSESG